MADQPTPTIDVLCVGNAIVDVLCRVDDAFLDAQGLVKGSMALIDSGRAHELYGAMGPAVETSGGSAANTAAGLASLGSRVAFVGRVRDDQLGEVFAHDLRSIGVRYDTAAATGGASTARCLILVTPDAERTMSTFLGASAELGPEDVPEELVAAAAVTYVEGYLWDAPRAKEAILHAMRLATAHGRKVALTLSDGFCVDRHRAEFLDLVEHHVDVLFANEAEITALYEVGSFDDALQHVRGHVEVAALTRSGKGSVVLLDGEFHVIDPEPVTELVDTTGAGDLYAAGFLHGLTTGRDAATCGRLGSLSAAEVLTQLGPRPARSLREVAAAAGL